MKVETTLRKIMDKEFRPALQRVMSKWNEARDIHAFVRISQALEQEAKAFSETQKALSDKYGFQIQDGLRSANADEITDHLLQKYGRFTPEGRLTIGTSSDAEKKDFLEAKQQADACIRKFNEELNKVVDEPITLEIPRKIKVTDKQFRKEVITAQECFTLEPILDLSSVSDLEEVSDSEE